MRRGEKILVQLFDYAQATVEQPKNADKGGWDDLALDELYILFLGEVEEFCCEWEIYKAGDKSGLHGMIAECPDPVIYLAMLFERLQAMLIEEAANG